MLDLWEPTTRKIPNPCGRFCAGREPGCAVMCCTWQLYVTIRNYLYNQRFEEKRNMELNDKATGIIARARDKEAKKGRKERA